MFEKFDEAHEKAKDSIRGYLNIESGSYDEGMVPLVKWLLETDINPYSFLQPEWACSVNTADGMASLLSNIHHALYDDGDITFVTVNGQHRIIFAHPTDDGFEERCLMNGEKDLRDHSRWPVQYDVKVLKITPEEFCQRIEAEHTMWIKDCFLSDIDNIESVEYYAAHYRKQYRCWDESWLEEARQQCKNAQTKTQLRHALLKKACEGEMK